MIARMPIRLRLALVFAGCMALLLGAAGLFLYLRLGAELQQSTDAALRSEASVIAAGLGQGGSNFGDQGPPVRGLETFAQVLGPGGKVVDSSQAIGTSPLVSPQVLASLRGPAYFDRTVAGVEGMSRLLVVPAGEGGQPMHIVVGSSLAGSKQVLSRFLALLLIGGPVALGLASWAGWLLAGAALRPVERVRREAAAVSVSDLGRRLPVPPAGDELARLVVTLNEMLARLESSFERERRFVDDASHELRTPLTIMKAELDLALSRARTPAETDAALRSASIETDRLAALAEDLLVYSRTVGGRVPVDRAAERLDEIARASCDAHQRLADRSGVALRLDAAEVTAAVDGMRIRQALDNLLDNALRHAPGGSVEVRVTADGLVAHLVVEDDGSGFEPAVLDTVFDPFTRGSAERASLAPGAGLGLAIVRAVAITHGGSATACNRPEGGARITLDLPLSPEVNLHPRLTTL